jgi:hypothetical protein
MPDDQIIAQQAHAKHRFVGCEFRAWDEHCYLCSSYDPESGYWIAGGDAPEEHRSAEHTHGCRNVLDRAIRVTYHNNCRFDGREFSLYGPKPKHQQEGVPT